MRKRHNRPSGSPTTASCVQFDSGNFGTHDCEWHSNDHTLAYEALRTSCQGCRTSLQLPHQPTSQHFMATAARPAAVVVRRHRQNPLQALPRTPAAAALAAASAAAPAACQQGSLHKLAAARRFGPRTALPARRAALHIARPALTLASRYVVSGHPGDDHPTQQLAWLAGQAHGRRQASRTGALHLPRPVQPPAPRRHCTRRAVQSAVGDKLLPAPHLRGAYAGCACGVCIAGAAPYCWGRCCCTAPWCAPCPG